MKKLFSSIENIINYAIIINQYLDHRYKSELEGELEFLENPDLMLQKLHEIEGNIMRLLCFKDNLIKETKDIEKRHKTIFGKLQSRYEDEEMECTKIIPKTAKITKKEV